MNLNNPKIQTAATPAANTPVPGMGSDSGDAGSALGRRKNDAGTGDEMLDRVVQGAHDTVDKLAHTAAPHVKQLHEGLQAASESTRGQVDSLRASGGELAESLRCTVREHPFTAIATALALGVLVARLTEPRH